MGKSLVIDTDITSAASKSTKGTPSNCRRFLETVRKFEHTFIFSSEIQREWNIHRSGWSQTWLRTMYARRLVENDVPDEPNPELRKKISRYSRDAVSREAMLKDIHLLETAMMYDRIVTSRNDTERGRFADVCQNVGEIRNIIWVNPDTESQFCLDWLQCGAPIEEKRKLGYQHRPR